MFRKACFLLLALILIPRISHAEIITYTHTVIQTFGGSQSPDDARIGAIAKAKREALEKAGTYLQSMTIVRESVIDKDEIIALSAGVLKAEIVSQKNFATKDAFGIIVTAKVDVDTSILEKQVIKFLEDRSLLEKYNESQKHEKELLTRIKELERENQKLKTLPSKEQKKKKEILKDLFAKATQGLTASELWKKALALWTNGEYTDPDKALDYLNKAIELNPGYAKAYYNRAVIYEILGRNRNAVDDYDNYTKILGNKAGNGNQLKQK
jgi:tetratricopeptide (TPR) repeat protein